MRIYLLKYSKTTENDTDYKRERVNTKYTNTDSKTNSSKTV